MKPKFGTILTWLAILMTAPWAPATSEATVAPTVSSQVSISERISTPVRMASDLMGNFYVSDPRAGGILKYSSQGKFLALFPTVGTPQGVAVTVGGDLIVGEGSFVSVLSPAGVEKYRLGIGEGQFKMANGIALDPSGRIYVVDSLDNCIQVFGADGTPLTIAGAAPGKPANSFGSLGKGSGQLSQPTGIAFESLTGTLAVADTLNSRIQFFNTNGTPVKSVGSLGSGSGKFTSPEGVSFSHGAAGTLMYVVDTFQSNIQVIDPESASFLRVIGSYGTGSGRLVAPMDALFDSFDPNNERLLVANGEGTMTMYGIDLPAPTPTVGGPALTVDPLPLATNLSALTVTGSVSAGATLRVSATTAALIGAVTFPSTTTWSIPVTGLTPGNNLLTVIATGISGKSTTASANILVLPPSGSAPITPLTVDALPQLTSIGLLAMHGTVQPGSTVAVNGNPATVVGGSWNYQAGLAEGANSLLITAQNPSLSDATTGVSVVLDSIAPQLKVSMLPTGSATSSQRFPISGSVADSSSTVVQVVVNGGAPVLIPVVAGSFSTAALLTQGVNVVGVTAIDAAGNASPTALANVSLVPSAPALSFVTPDGTTVSADNVQVSGTVTPGSAVAVNGVPATVTGGGWKATVPLLSGLNTLVATATLGDSISSAKVAITLNPAAPPLAVALPGNNALVLGGPTQNLSVTGSAATGSSVSATVNGNPVPVTIKPDGSFGIGFTVPTGSFGTYTVAVSEVDQAGNATTSVRELTVADPTPPPLTVESTDPVKVSVSGGGVLSVRDKNGPVGAVVVSGNTASIDLTGVVYDPATLDITAVTPGGSSSRNGVLVPVQEAGQSWSTGVPTIVDALASLKIASGVNPAGFNELLHGDVGPLVHGVPMPDGKIDIQDTVATMLRVLGVW